MSDKEFVEPLPGATVTIRETGESVTTGPQGNYVFRQLAPGTYRLVFKKDGYFQQFRDVPVSAGALREVDVALAGDFTEGEEYVVEDLSQFLMDTESGLLQLRFESPSLLDSVSADLMSRAGASDAASALRLVAGASTQDGKSAVIRGLPDRYVSSQLNGVRLPTANEDKRAVELDQFPSAVIESIQVSKTFTPDQQGDASGGAVDVRLRGIPDEPFFIRARIQSSNNSQVTGRNRFLTYDGGGVSFDGKDDGRRGIQYENIGGNWTGAVGVSEGEAPMQYKGSLALGGSHEFSNGVKIGGFASLFHERDSSFYDNGRDDSWWVESPGAPMTPQTTQGGVGLGEFTTRLFDITRGQESVQWGTLLSGGIAIENHSLNVAYLYSRTAEDTATLAEDTRGKEFFFPGHDPDDQNTPGHSVPEAAPYTRFETLDYLERTTESLQFHGRHVLPIGDVGFWGNPELDWTVALSSADSWQPDKRLFASQWVPGRVVGPVTIPATHNAFKPSATFALGNLQRIYKEIEEESEQYSVNLKLPFEQWTEDEGYLKFGYFLDHVDRFFDQDSFSNFNENPSFNGPFQQRWSSVFPLENHAITESEFDIDYEGDLDVEAWYAMMDLPIASFFKVIGGVRVESTDLSIRNFAEEDAVWYPPENPIETELTAGAADAAIKEDNVLPAIAFVLTPIEDVTIRASYTETIARQTFKEITPILQQEFVGGPIFIGNPNLQISELENWDIRVDWKPYEGGLVSASWFKKDIKNPIEYVQRIVTFDFTTAVNYPSGEMTGWELETRHHLGQFWDPLEGLSIGANATLIDATVQLPEDEIAVFAQPNIQAPITERDMTDAPEHLYNLYLTYDVPVTGTQVGLFYTVQGDTLVAGAGQASPNFIPNIYAKEFDTLNLSVSQRFGEHFVCRFQAKNLTNPEIQEIFRSQYIAEDVLNTSFTRGVDYSLSIGAEVRF